MSRLGKSYPIWFWASLLVAFLAALECPAYPLMDAWDIFEQWADYVDEDVLDQAGDVHELWELTGGEAEFQEDWLYRQQYGNVLTLGAFSTNGLLVYFPARVVVYSNAASFSLEIVPPSEWSYYEFPHIPEDIPFPWVRYQSVMVPSSVGGSAVLRYRIPLNYITNDWSTFISSTNQISFNYGLFSKVVAVPYGPYWHQDSVVGFCSYQTWSEVIGVPSITSRFWSCRAAVAPLVATNTLVRYFYSTPSPYSFTSHQGIFSELNPVDEKALLHETFSPPQEIILRPRRNPWLQ